MNNSLKCCFPQKIEAAVAEKRKSRYLYKVSVMKILKKTLLTIALIIISLCSSNTIAQIGGRPQIVNSEELYHRLDDGSSNNLRTGFCHDFEVTVDLIFMEITTTVTICCAEEISGCVPIVQSRGPNRSDEDPNDLVITNSSSTVYGEYRISILNGNYHVNSKGEITDLKYKLTLN